MTDNIIIHDKKRKILLEAFEFIKSFTTDENKSNEFVSKSHLEKLHKYIDEYDIHAVDRLKVYLIGEFNSGKSSLINAMLSQSIAPTDIFEMTSWIARYWSGEKELCSVRLKNGQEEIIDRNDFYDKCKNREYSKAELSAIERIDIIVPNNLNQLVLIDTPGFGAINSDNEKLMVDNLYEADVVLFVIDVDSVGGITEMSLINELLKSDIPIHFVLTKSDLVEDANEIDEIIGFIKQNMKLTNQQIFITSTINFENDTNGVKSLKKFLDSQSSRSTILKQKAQKSHYARSASMLINQLDLLEKNLESTSEAIKEFEKVLSQIKKSINTKSKRSIQRIVKEDLFTESYNSLLKSLVEAMHNNNGKLDGVQIENCVTTVSGSGYLNRFTSNLVEELGTEIPVLWERYLRDRSEELDEIFKKYNDKISQNNVKVNSVGTEFGLDDITFLSAGKGLKVSAGFAAAFAGYAAWLGPASAAVTLPMAITGIGIPIMFFGMVGTAIHVLIKRGKAKDRYGIIAEGVIDKIKDECTKSILGNIYPQIEKHNDEISFELLEKYNSNNVVLPGKDIGSISKDLRRFRDALQSI